MTRPAACRRDARAAGVPVVLVIDECTALLSRAPAGGKAGELAAIIRLGRASGVTVTSAARPAVAGSQALAAASGTVTSEELPMMLNALDDAAAWRREHAESYCWDCSRHPAELCQEHAHDLDRAGEYAAFAAALAAASTRQAPR